MIERLHIGQFTNTYKPVLSGVVRSVSSYREALTDLGHNVFVFAQQTLDYEDEEPFIFRYPALEIPAYKYPVTIPVSRTIDNILPSLKLDVIHAHHPVGLGEVAIRKAKEFNIPMVFTHHTRYRDYAQYFSLVPKQMAQSVIDNFLVDFMTRCQHIVVPSESMKRALADVYGISHYVTVIPTGIDLRPYQEADRTAVRRQLGWRDDQRILISVGRLANVKNWPLLLDAMAIVMNKHQDVHFVLLGDGPERSELEDQVKKLKIEPRVTFMGRVPYEAVPGYLKAADLFCFASVTETQGLVTLEALAAGVPVVAVDAGGTAETITHRQEGLLTEESSQALADAVDEILRDETLYHDLQAAAVSKAEAWDIHVLAHKLLDVYAQAAETKAAERVVQADNKKPFFELNWRDFFQLPEAE